MKKVRFVLLIIITLLFTTIVGCTLENVDQTKLDTPIISISDGVLFWSKVDRADGYIININNKESSISQIKFDLRELEVGEYTIKVKAFSNGELKDSDYSNILNYTVDKTKERLSTPVISITENVVSWDEVPHADTYKLYVNDSIYVSTNKLSYSLAISKEGVYQIYVIASDNTENYLDSHKSNVVEYEKVTTYLKISEVKTLIDESAPSEVKVNFIGKVIGFDSLGYAHVADETGVIYVRAIHPLLVLDNIVKINGTGFIYRGSSSYPEYTRQIRDTNLHIELYQGDFEGIKPVEVLTKEKIWQYNADNYRDASFMGNIVSIKGIVEVGETRYSFYLNDDLGNHIVAIHHYSSNFQNDIYNHDKNVFLDLDGQVVTLTGIMYRFYNAENIWTFQCIGLTNELITNSNKLLTPSVTLADSTISWDQIANATGYGILLNGEYYDTTTECSYDLSKLESGRYEVSVHAFDITNAYEKSSNSKIVIFYKDVLSSNINIFMINDAHGAFIDDVNPGVERVSTLINELENANGDSIKIANGDIFQGTYVSSILYGLPMIDALNEMDFDAFIIGNHEFDWGLEKIHDYKDGNPSNGEANFPFVCANIYDKSTNQRVDWLEPYTIVENNGQKVGIIGLIGYNLETSILTENVKNYDFVYPLDLVKDYADELRNDKNCDSVVVSIHDYDPDLNSRIASLSGSSKVDAILCGHTHTDIYESIKRSDNLDIPVVQNRDKNNTASFLTLKVSNANLDSWQYGRFYPAAYDKDLNMEKVINKYNATIEEGNRSLGTTYNYLSRDVLGGYAVSAMKDEYLTDFAIMNTGGIRATISGGNITVAQVFEVVPFNNKIYLTKLSGKALKSLYEANSSYLYISDNYYSSTISDNTIYTIAVIDYVYTSEWYQEFVGTTFTDTQVIMRDLLVDFLDEMYA